MDCLFMLVCLLVFGISRLQHYVEQRSRETTTNLRGLGFSLFLAGSVSLAHSSRVVAARSDAQVSAV